MQQTKVWPVAAALAEGSRKPPYAALAEDRRGERCGRAHKMRQVPEISRIGSAGFCRLVSRRLSRDVGEPDVEAAQVGLESGVLNED